MKKLLPFLLTIGCASSAVAQVIQPTYVRPAKGTPITLAQVTASSVSATFTSTAVFDWSAFAGVVVTANATGPSGTFTACKYGVNVKALGSTSTNSGDFFLLNVANNDYRADSSQSWYVRVLPGYLRFVIGTYQSNASGQSSCTYKVTATPLPFDYAGQLYSTAVLGIYAQSQGPEVSFVPAVVTAVPTYSYVRVQNIDSSALAYCKPVGSDGVAPNPGDYLNWPIWLRPYDVIEIENWVGTLHCIGKVGIFGH